METENRTGESREGKANDKFNYRRGKPPDKRRHQLEMGHYTDLIHEKEAILKSLKVQNLRRSTSSVHGSRDELLTKLRVLKTEIDQKMEQKQMIIAELKTLTQQVVKKNETCMKLQANVKYKDEQRTNNAIKNLERHLSTHQLKLSEEKKLVCEIDALKRSKKTLSEYLCAQQEVEQLRQQQSRLRNERDMLIREIQGIRGRENDVKVSLDSLKEDETDGEEKKPAIDRDALKKEIDALYEQRRELHENYKQALAKYHEDQKEIEQEKQQMKAVQRRDETRLTKITIDRARQENRPHPKPFEEENSICDCLIQYLAPLMAVCSSEIEESDGNKTTSKYLDVPKFEPGISEEGSYAINPDDHLGGLFAPSNRRITRKGSRKGRKSKDSAAQKLVLHPHVFEQFLKLNLDPPSTYADVSGILDKLRAKKNFNEKESGKSNQALMVTSDHVPVKGTEEKDVGEHEKAQLKHDLDEAQHEISTDEHEQDPVSNETLQSEHGIENFQHDHDAAEHEVQKDEHGSGQPEHDIALTQHENEQAKDEKDKVAHEYVDDEDMSIYKNERSLCRNEEVLAENMLNKSEGNEFDELPCKEDPNKDILNRSTVITDALEKGIDGIKIKESSPEIQVRVT